MPTLDFPTANLLNVRIHNVCRADVIAWINAAARGKVGGNICNVNVHAMNTACKDEEFRHVLNGADLVFVDGAGVKLGARLAGIKVGARLTPADWVDELLTMCGKENWPIFWLGDTDDVGADFEHAVRRRHPQCPFAGRHHGFFAKSGSASDSVVDLINRSGARILMVGMSMPIQEKWIWSNRERLAPPVRLALGGLARIYTGHIRRGPPWMTNNGFEWLYRLFVQPGYTWQRYLIGNPLFLARVTAQRLGLYRTLP
jgi:N-acetylglucosaminyldiphosphoundecaprenol N-acetyl-beta-D-mannosaminyltransferase